MGVNEMWTSLVFSRAQALPFTVEQTLHVAHTEALQRTKLQTLPIDYLNAIPPPQQLRNTNPAFHLRRIRDRSHHIPQKLSRGHMVVPLQYKPNVPIGCRNGRVYDIICFYSIIVVSAGQSKITGGEQDYLKLYTRFPVQYSTRCALIVGIYCTCTVVSLREG
ncbi:hypothetical protein BGX38DRAFT_581107 [Terfezia claveryi]|nr:hypothetical protein BGX38DRAFT_581107 [Terfezia claveryi]